MRSKLILFIFGLFVIGSESGVAESVVDLALAIGPSKPSQYRNRQ